MASNWRLIETQNLSTVRSLAIDAAGVIYVGAALDFGYLAPNASGQLQYVSLGDKVPEDARGFNDVWRTFVTPSGVLFQTEHAVFRWHDGVMTTIRPTSRFNRASLVDGQMYLTMPETGLNVLDGDTFRPLPGTARLGSEVTPSCSAMTPGVCSIGRRFGGFWLYDGAGAHAVSDRTRIEFLKNASLYRGIALPDGTIALSTTNAGMAIMDREGRRLLTVGRAQGLPSDAVYNLMADREGAIWTVGERGIGRVEYPSPATAFGEADGYLGAWVQERHQGRLLHRQAEWRGLPGARGWRTPGAHRASSGHRAAKLGVRRDDRRPWRAAGARRRVYRWPVRDSRHGGHAHSRGARRHVQGGCARTVAGRPDAFVDRAL